MKGRTYFLLGIAAISIITLFIVYGSILNQPREKIELIFLTPPAVYRPLEKAILYFNENSETYRILTIVQPTGALVNRLKLDQRGDVFGSADSIYMEKLVEEGFIHREKIFLLSYSIPAMIVPKGNPAGIHSLKDLAEKNVPIGIANPDVSPAGRIAVEVLKQNEIYERVKDRIVIFSDINELARQVSLGLLPVGISWHFIYYWNPNELDIVWFDKDEIPGIECQLIGVLKTSNNSEVAEHVVKSILEYAKKNGELRRYGYITSLEDLQLITPYDNVSWTLPSICILGVKYG